MLGKVTKWLGIEGVKLEIVLEEAFDPKSGMINGMVQLQSKKAQTVTAIKFALIEKYARGRKEEQLIDEYQLGDLVIKETIDVPAGGEVISIPFALPFSLVASPVDEFGSRNPVFGGLAWVARKMRRVQSEFRIEAEANVKGVGLNPFDRKVLA